jgi:hypothetical protein
MCSVVCENTLVSTLVKVVNMPARKTRCFLTWAANAILGPIGLRGAAVGSRGASCAGRHRRRRRAVRWVREGVRVRLFDKISLDWTAEDANHRLRCDFRKLQGAGLATVRTSRFFSSSGRGIQMHMVGIHLCRPVNC